MLPWYELLLAPGGVDCAASPPELLPPELLEDAPLLPVVGACPEDTAGIKARPRSTTSGLHPVPHNSPALRLILESTSACNLMALKKGSTNFDAELLVNYSKRRPGAP
jgi:hypothetical protein